MLVKTRKVGNSFVLTIPASLAEAMRLDDGQEMEVDYNPYSGTLSYHPQRISEINWDEFVSQDKEDIRDGMKPEEYVRALRDFDREEIIL